MNWRHTEDKGTIINNGWRWRLFSKEWVGRVGEVVRVSKVSREGSAGRVGSLGKVGSWFSFELTPHGIKAELQIKVVMDIVHQKP